MGASTDHNPSWEGFLANWDAAGKLFPNFPAVRRSAIPAKVWAFPARKMAAGKSDPLLEVLLRDRHSLLEFF